MRVTISEEEKFLTNSVATFRDNKQALYGSFQYVLNTTKTQLTKYCKSWNSNLYSTCSFFHAKCNLL